MSNIIAHFNASNLRVATISGIFGNCRREELYDLTVDAIIDARSSIIENYYYRC